MAAGCSATTHTAEEFRAACREYVAAHGQLRSFARYEQPANIFWDDQKYRGEAYAAFAWAVYVAEVTVDLTTYSVSVDDFVALQEVGRVLNPVLARGQIVGGVAQGIGFALYEKVDWRDGRMQNGQMTNYIMPTSADMPPIRVFFEEMGNTHGAYGAKGIGELPMDGPAPAIVNADRRCARDSVRFDSAASGRYFRRDGFRIEAARAMLISRPECDDDRRRAKREISLTVNGEPRTVRAYPMERLLDVLRQQLGLTGTKEGCGEGECGACSVMMDGALVNSCLVPVLQAQGANIVTIEGLGQDARACALQQAFLECGGAQCGICTPGMILAAVHLLREKPEPTLDDIRRRACGQSLPLHGIHPDFRGGGCSAARRGVAR